MSPEDAVIDLRSDTVTKPTPAMREAMARAEVGDDVYGEDPTVNRLEEYAAGLLGREAALFLPTGTMANLTAILAQTRPGETIILSEESHPYHYEGGNVAMVAGLMTRTVPDPLGKINAAQVAARINQVDDPHYSHTTLVSIENTSNRGGGACYSVDEVAAIGTLCRERGLRLHCDGARIFNAAVAMDVAPAAFARHCDTLCFCLSKGLGAPAGSILTGDKKTIHAARRFRKMLGGGMRQAGILAAAGLYALEHHIPDLKEDHRRARECRTALEAVGVRFPLPSPTNILYVESPDAGGVVARLARLGVRVNTPRGNRFRLVFHRDITDAMLQRAIAALIEAMS